MWHTSRGDRTLDGHEAVLVCRAIEVMVGALLVHVDDEFEDSAPDCETGIAIYDVCTPSQRIGLLHEVAKYLLTRTDEPLVLSALNDATVAAIFMEIRDQIAIEIEFAASHAENGQPSWRQMVLAAHRSLYPESSGGERGERVYESMFRQFDASTEDLRHWEALVDDLADSILWDRDFEMAEGFLDIDPGVSRQRRRLLGIDDEYFTSVAPDPRPEQAYQLASRTREIVRARPR